MTELANRRVVACLDSSPSAEVVLTTAANVATSLHAVLDVITVRAPGEPSADEPVLSAHGESLLSAAHVRTLVGPIEDTLVAELAHDDVIVGVLGSRALSAAPELFGHVARAVVTRSRRTLIVIPPGAAPLTGSGQRFLVPLDGSGRTSRAVSAVLADLVEPLGTVVPVHVFDRERVPMFVSSSQDQAVIADEFAARHLGSSVSRAERPRLRVGDPGQAILAAIGRDEADAVVVCWSQHLGTGRAAVIRALLTHGGVPVILQPLDAGRSADPRSG